MNKKRTLILGGGYAGLGAMRRLARKMDPNRYETVLIDASAYHTIKTRFHELAISRKRDRWIRFPLTLLTRASGAEFIQARVQRLNLDKRRVYTSKGPEPYDILLVTLGGVIAFYGVRGARKHAASLQTYEDALQCSGRIASLGLLQRKGPRRRVVVCGAGIEGIEVASTLRQYASPKRCEIFLVERSDKVMAASQCSDRQRRYILRHFDRHSVHVVTGSGIREVRKDRVCLESGRKIETDLVIWSSGIERTHVTGLQKGKPFVVDKCLQSPEHPEVFATGDFARVQTENPWSNLFSAQRALYQADVLANNVFLVEHGRPLREENYEPKGELIALGDFDGVGVVGGLPVQGKSAALMKKANEVKYLTSLFRDVPGSVANLQAASRFLKRFPF